MDATGKEINQQLAVEIVRFATEATDFAASGKMAESDTAIALLKEAVDRLALCGVASKAGMLHRLQSPCGFPTK